MASNTQVQFGPPSGKPTAASARGRVCMADGCVTILSIYNHSQWCSVHEQLAPRGTVAFRSPR